MKILAVNKFFYNKGGADKVFLETCSLFKDRGHEIVHFSSHDPKNFHSGYEKYFISNVDYDDTSMLYAADAALKLLYSFEARRNIKKLIVAEKPDIAHLHNIYHQISPSILHSLKRFKIPIVMTLHDYKPVCASYLLFAGGKTCEACKGGKYFNCFLKKCVKNSRAKSLLNTIEMYLHHNIMHIYDLVDVFISPSVFLMDKLKEMGFKKQIVYLPNFVDAGDSEPRYDSQEKSIVYFGRLSREKGLLTLIEAAKGLDVKLKIIGEGPVKEILVNKMKATGCKNIEFLGYRSGESLKDEIKKSMFVVLPSEWYENNPLAIVEGFALGKPAVGARIGGIPELVIDNKTGLTFEPGNAEDLRAKLVQLLNSPSEVRRMGRNAMDMVESKFNQKIYYERLMQIYDENVK